MILRLRLLVLLCRPAVVVILGLFAATGLAQGGAGDDPLLLGQALVAVVAFLLFSVVLNDLSDEAVDRVNLPGRPLVAGAGTRREFQVVAVTSAALALGAGATIGWRALAVVAAGLASSAAYSLRPIRVADRGAVASVLLPWGYVAVPYLVGIFAVRSTVTAGDLVLLGGLYVGFIGRILLKDFRDVRGDALFGKRTFVVRHGRRATCRFSAVCWLAGTVSLAGVRNLTPDLVAGHLVFVAVALALLGHLARSPGARRDEALISAVAVIGRGMMATLIAHLAMTDRDWTTASYRGVMILVVLTMVGQALTMARQGPPSRLRLGLRLTGRGEGPARRRPVPDPGPVAAG